MKSIRFGSTARIAGTWKIAVMLIWLYVILLGGTWAVVSSFEVRLVSELLLIGILGAWLAWSVRREKPILSFDLGRPLLALLVAAASASAFSIAPRLSAETALLYAGYALLFLFALNLVRFKAREVYEIFAVCSVAIAVASLAEPVVWYFGLAPAMGYAVSWPSIAPDGAILPLVWERSGFVAGNPNVLAGFLAPWVPVALAAALSSTDSKRRIRGLAWLALLSIALAATLSRGGMFAALVGLMAVGLGWMPSWRRRIRRTISARIVAFLAICVFTAIFTAARFLPSGLQAGSAGVRVDLWNSAIDIVARHPLFGIGPDTFGLALLQYQTPTSRAEDFLPHPHNLYLGIAAESGIAGLLAALWLACAVYHLWQRGSRIDSERQVAGHLRLGLAAGMLTMAAHGLVEDFRIYPTLLIQAIAFVSLAIPLQRPSPTVDKLLPSPRLAVCSAALILPAILFSFTRLEVATAAQLVQAGDLGKARQLLADAANRDQGIALYRTQSALLQATQASAHDDQNALDDAIAQYRSAIAAEPHYPLSHANLAALLWQSHDGNGAIVEMGRALALQPANVRYRFNLAALLDEHGQEGAADAQYTILIKADPAMLRTAAWRRTITRDRQERLISQVWEQLHDEPPNAQPVQRGRLAYAAARFEVARQEFSDGIEVDPNSFDAWRGLGLSLQSLGDMGESAAALQRAVVLSPTSAQAHAELAMVLLALGAQAEAAHEANTALFIQTNPIAHVVLARIEASQGRDDLARSHFGAALPTRTFDIAYSGTAWRRQGIPMDAVPQLTDVVSDEAGDGVFAEFARFLSKRGRQEDVQRLIAQWAAYDPLATRREQGREKRIGMGSPRPSWPASPRT